MRNSRTMSCALGMTWPSGGRRRTHCRDPPDGGTAARPRSLIGPGADREDGHRGHVGIDASERPGLDALGNRIPDEPLVTIPLDVDLPARLIGQLPVMLEEHPHVTAVGLH